MTTTSQTAKEKIIDRAGAARATVVSLASTAKDRLPSAALVKDNTRSVAISATDTKAKRISLAAGTAAVLAALAVVGLRRRNKNKGVAKIKNKIKRR